MSNNNYGSIIIGPNTGNQTEEIIEDFFKARYHDGRLITLCKIKTGYYIVVENPVSSGRDPQQKMLLTEESFMALMLSMNLFVHGLNIDTFELLKRTVERDKVEFESSVEINIQ